MVLESVTSALPGWELVLFIGLFLTFLLAGGITSFIILSRLRWPFKWVVTEDTAGKGHGISRRGRCRLIALGDMGEEIFLLKNLNKYKIAGGERIGPKQIGWAVGEDGIWYSWKFGDFNKHLREMGVKPVSRGIRLSMSAARKNLDNRLGDKSWIEKYGPILYFGMFILTLFIFAGLVWYSTNKQVEIANINSQSLETNVQTQEAIQKTLGQLDNILSRINTEAQTPQEAVGGSGLVSENG